MAAKWLPLIKKKRKKNIKILKICRQILFHICLLERPLPPMWSVMATRLKLVV